MATRRWTRVGRLALLVLLSSLTFVGTPPAPISAASLPSDVLAWGWNGYGQLGDGTTTTPRTTPVTTSGLTNVVALAAGYDHSLALLGDGTVKAWGDNYYGQLGDGTTTNRSSPVTVSGLGPGSGVVAIAAGSAHSLALLGDGSVKAWGQNGNGQLGDGTTTTTGCQCKSSPVSVSGLGVGSGVIAIAAGGLHSLALLSDGTVKAWGLNGTGQLGDGTTTDRSSPVTVSGLGAGSGVVAIVAGGYHSLALLSDGTVKAWGHNIFGQLGDGTTTTTGCQCKSSPVAVSGLGTGGGVIAIAAGDSHSLALLSNGALKAWGSNPYGQLGDGTTATNFCHCESSPVTVSGLGAGSGVVAIAAGAGSDHSLALLSDGTLDAWGLNGTGQLGDGTTTYRSSPVSVSGLGPGSGVAALAAGGGHTLVLRNPSATYSWGAGGDGRLGDGSATDRHFPTPALPTNVVALAAGDDHSLALLSDGTLKAWGNNDHGELGNGTTVSSSLPVTVCASGSGSGCPALTNVVAIAAGDSHSLALLSDGTLKAWGDNASGQLGDGTTSTSGCQCKTTPVTVSGLTTVVAVATGSDHSLALLSDGTLKAWGDNDYGQVGNGTATTTGCRCKPTPVTVSGLGAGSGVVAIAGGGLRSLALLSDGTVKAWGWNGYGQLGDGTQTTPRTTPVTVCASGSGSGCAPLTGVVALAAGYDHSLALLSDGTVKGWGGNYYGQLGDGTTTNRSSPVSVSGLTKVVAIAAGSDHSLALKSGGGLKAWGYNASGQLGDGSTTDRSSPVSVDGLTTVVAMAAGGSHSLAVRGALSSLATTSVPAPVPFAGTVLLRATLTATAGGAGLAGQPVQFWFNGQVRCGNGTSTVCPTTNTGGIAELIVGGTSGLPLGDYPIIARYQGAADVAPELVTGTVTVVKADQTIVLFTNPGAKTSGDPPFTVSATATSGLPVSFSSLTTPVCTVSGTTVTIVSAGSCTIRASQAGNSDYNAAPSVDHTFTITTANQPISVAALANKPTTAPPSTVSATASSGLPVVIYDGEVGAGGRCAERAVFQRAGAVVPPRRVTGGEDATAAGAQHNPLVGQAGAEHPPDRRGVKAQPHDGRAGSA